MARTHIPQHEESSAEAKPILDNVKKQLGFVPHLHRLMAKSPHVLNGWLGLMSNLAKTLDAKTRDGIALAVTAVNGCAYCNAAHSYVASTMAKISEEEIALNREGRSSDPKRQAAIAFAKKVTETRGKVDEADFKAVKDAGYSDTQILEIVGLSAQFLMTNFINNVFDTDIDFPPAEAKKA